MSDAEWKTADIGDVSLSYREAGNNEPVIFLHGALSDARVWTPVIDHLPPDIRAIAPTQRYFGPGRQSHGGRPFGTGQQRDDLFAFMETLELKAAHVVGWSFSAHSALGATIAAPERVLSLCLYDCGFPTFVTNADALAAIAAANAETFAPLAAAAEAGDWQRAAQILIDGAAMTPGYFTDQAKRNRRIHLDNAHTIPLLFTQTPPVAISEEMLLAANVRTTIGWGETSPLPYRLISKTAAEIIPSCRAQEISARGHLWPESHAEEFAAFVTAHLKAD